MQINPKLIKNQFEKSMDKYNQNAIVQQIMAEKIINEILKVKKHFQSILELGCGTGLLTREITQKLIYEKYYANDLVEKSKLYLTEILPEFTFICGNASRIKTNKNVDLIISNAMFQWFNDLEKSTGYYKNILNPEGILAFTTFSPENFNEIKDITGLSLDYANIIDIKNCLKKNYEIIYSEEFKHKLTFKTPLELLAHMKNTGVNSLATRHWTFKEVKEFCDSYKSKFPEITLTYSPIIIIAKKI